VPLFHWQSNALKQYSCGDIVAIGGTVDEARAAARALVPAWIAENRSWLSDSDPEDAEELRTLRALFEADLAAEPVICAAALINGGE
jgi:hypothetical protein